MLYEASGRPNGTRTLRVIIVDSAEAVSKFAANMVCESMAAQQSDRPYDPYVLGLATGGTPLGLYHELIQRYQKGEVTFAHVTSFNLDEYVGVPPEDPQSYRYYMNANLFQHIDIDLERTHVPDTRGNDLNENAVRYENAIRTAGGIDLQVLGIGADGHIGFNEIGSSLASRTRVKTLTQRTRQDNARFFDSIDDVPQMAITMGIATILEARSIVLLATGDSKSIAIRNCIEGPIASTVPASVLQWHANVAIIIDEAAGSALENCQYYKESEHNRELLSRKAIGYRKH